VFRYEFFFLIFFNLAWGDIFSNCWVTSGVVLDKAIAAQFCTVVAFSQAPGQRNGYVGIWHRYYLEHVWWNVPQALRLRFFGCSFSLFF
jgi:hypothetical protein